MASNDEVLYVRIPGPLKKRAAAAAEDLAISMRKLIELALSEYLKGFEEYQAKPVRLRMVVVAEPLAEGEQASDEQSGETE